VPMRVERAPVVRVDRVAAGVSVSSIMAHVHEAQQRHHCQPQRADDKQCFVNEHQYVLVCRGRKLLCGLARGPRTSGDYNDVRTRLLRLGEDS
jgi:hypothetical protein